MLADQPSFYSQLPLISIIISALALYIGFTNYRLGHHVIVKIIRCEAHSTFSVDHGPYYQFSVYIRNIGIPLHDLGMTMLFRPPSTGGTASISLQTSDGEHRRTGQFAKGMVTEFVFRTDRFQPHDAQFLLSLRDLRDQRARLILHSDGYRAWEYRLDKPRRLKRWWNRVASQFSHLVRRTRGTNPEGHEIVSFWPELPRFLIPSNQLEQFLGYLRRPDFPLDQEPGDNQVRIGYPPRA